MNLPSLRGTPLKRVGEATGQKKVEQVWNYRNYQRKGWRA